MCINFLDSFRLTQERARSSVKGGGQLMRFFVCTPLEDDVPPPKKKSIFKNNIE